MEEVLRLGESLVALCAKAQQKALLVAPFVKRDMLERLLAALPPDVSVRCVTRWRPEEVIAGVSDLEVWPLLRERSQSTLFLRPDLHAKYYRADESCLVGSANLTATALGWTRHPNLELLVPLPADAPALVGFEATLLAGCVPVTDELYAHMRAVCERLRAQQPPPPPLLLPNEADAIVDEEASPKGLSPEAWLPQLRHPEDLYTFYSGHQDDLTTAAREAARHDLEGLPITPGLPKGLFEAAVGALLLQKPIPHQVDDFVSTARRFGEVRDLLARLPCATAASDFDASHAWQTLMRWLLYFLPERYSYTRPRHSEIFARRVDKAG